MQTVEFACRVASIERKTLTQQQQQHKCETMSTEIPLNSFITNVIYIIIIIIIIIDVVVAVVVGLVVIEWFDINEAASKTYITTTHVLMQPPTNSYISQNIGMCDPPCANYHTHSIIKRGIRAGNGFDGLPCAAATTTLNDMRN